MQVQLLGFVELEQMRRSGSDFVMISETATFIRARNEGRDQKPKSWNPSVRGEGYPTLVKIK